jgi:hypothetical protein
MGWNDVETTSKPSEDKIPYTSFKEGNTLIRVIDEEPYSFWSHWMQKQQTSVTCLGKDCPICDVIAQQRASKQTPTYGNSKRHAIRIWNYDTKQMEVMIQGTNFFSQLLTLHKEVDDITKYDIKVRRSGSGTDTNYMLLPQQPAPFAHAEEVSDVDMAKLFEAKPKEIVLQLMEGKSWDEIYKDQEGHDE